MSLQSRLNSLRKHPDTVRAGIKWTEYENNQLMKEVIDGMDFDEIAKKHQRTITGVKLRVMINALIMMKDRDLTFQDVAKLVHINEYELENHRQMQEDKAKEDTKVKKSVTKTYESLINDKDFMSVLTEIRDYLKIIAEK